MEKNLKPKDWVLVRDSKDLPWQIDIFKGCGGYYALGDCEYCCLGGQWKYCIPYESNEYLLDTTDSPKEHYEPEDGEFVVSDGEGSLPCEHISIFKNILPYSMYSCYASLSLLMNNLSLESTWSSYYLRLATEEEKQFLLSKLHEIGKDWDAENKKIVNYKWQPNKGDEYYILQYSSNDDEFLPLKMWWNNTEYDKGRMKEGIAYRTKKECQKVCDRRNETIKNIK